MHPSPKTLLIAAILLLVSLSIAQEATPSTDGPYWADFPMTIPDLLHREA